MITISLSEILNMVLGVLFVMVLGIAWLIDWIERRGKR